MPATSDDTVARIKSRLDLREIVAERVKLRRQGREWAGLCPFHQEDSPSFAVNPQTQVWYCFGCQRGGDIFAFVEQFEKTDFQGALQILAERAGVELDRDRTGFDRSRVDLKRRILKVNELAARYYEYLLRSSPAGAPGRELLGARQVDLEAARSFQLGYAPGGASLAGYLAKREVPLQDGIDAGLVRPRDGQDFFSRRLVIPIRDERGQPVAFTGRTVDPEVRAKYVNSPETPAYVKGHVLFALDLARPAIEERGYAVIMEGQFDVIAGHSFGVGNAIASSGTALTEDQLRLLKRFTEEVVLAFDSDDAGRAAALRAVPTAAAAGLRTRVVEYAGAKDPDEFLRAGDEPSRRWEALVAAARQGWEFRLATLQRGLNPSHPRDFEIGLARVRADLKDFQDPALKDLFRRRAAEWLGIEPALVTVEPQGRRGGAVNQIRAAAQSPAGARTPLTPAPATVGSGGPARRSDGTGSKAGVYLLQVLAIRPQAAAKIRDQVDPQELGEAERATYLKMLEAIDAEGLDVWSGAMAAFDDRERDLIRRARVSPPPSVEDEVVDSVVRQLRRGAREAELRRLRKEMLEAERQGDLDRARELQADHASVSRELVAMKRRSEARIR